MTHHGEEVAFSAGRGLGFASGSGGLLHELPQVVSGALQILAGGFGLQHIVQDLSFATATVDEPNRLRLAVRTKGFVGSGRIH